MKKRSFWTSLATVRMQSVLLILPVSFSPSLAWFPLCAGGCFGRSHSQRPFLVISTSPLRSLYNYERSIPPSFLSDFMTVEYLCSPHFVPSPWILRAVILPFVADGGTLRWNLGFSVYPFSQKVHAAILFSLFSFRSPWLVFPDCRVWLYLRVPALQSFFSPEDLIELALPTSLHS